MYDILSKCKGWKQSNMALPLFSYSASPPFELCQGRENLFSKSILAFGTWKLLSPSLDPTVRDYSCEALGVALKVVGEKQMMVFIADVDNLKQQKVWL